ncbi:hypothetical protein HAX54_052771 [Datura stramonium]|uniref:Uncharacterized protein n=1 Tax=Datura stramonium TaxID=4076 RepID=A0ABS8SZZ4_DATST|nr:hypothetical protein [Datura stramonium]
MHPGKGIDEETLNDQVDGEEPFPTTPATTSVATKASSTTTPVTTSGTTTTSITVDPTIVNGDGPNLGPVRADFIDEEGFDYSINDSVGSEGGLAGDNKEDYDSDMHEEDRELRSEKRLLKGGKEKRVPANIEEVPVGEAGPNLGFDETEISKISLNGRLGGDEPYYPSSDANSFEIDEEECCDEDENVESYYPSSDADSFVSKTSSSMS